MAESILHPIRLRELAKQWLLEDTANFDYAGAAVKSSQEIFSIYFKSPGILAGIPFANAIFSELQLHPEWLFNDGDFIEKPVQIVARISGSARNLLLAERVVLNVLSRASGVATIAYKMKARLSSANWKGSLAATRKCTPGFRMVEKYSLLIGGADMHRYDLSSMVMLKDNHVTMAGSISKAIEETKRYSGFSQKIEVECQSYEEAMDAAKAGCDIAMLDNFAAQELHEAAAKLKKQFGAILIEASGGITLENITEFASPNIDIISSSLLVQGYPTMDISMKRNK